VKESIKKAIEISEARSKLNELAAIEEPTAEQRSEMASTRTRMGELDEQYRDALREENAAENGDDGQAPDAEDRERAELRSKSRLGNWLLAASTGRAVNGAEAEYAAAAGIDDGGIPFDLFEADKPAKPETRADAPTAAPATVGINMDSIVPSVFSESIASQLMIDMPQVATGTYALPAITADLTAGMKGAGDDTDSTAATIGVSTTKPHRLSGRMSVRLEDKAAIGMPDFEMALRQNLQMVLSVALDNQILAGDGTGDNISGMLTRLSDPTDPTAVVTFANGVEALANLIDGLWAMRTGDVRQIVGVATYQLMASTFQAPASQGSNGELALSSYLMDHSAGLRTNSRMPAAASNIQQGIAVRTGRPGMRTAVLPTWGSVSIEDVYSGSGKAESYFTVHSLIGDLILAQSGAYSQVAYKVA